MPEFDALTMPTAPGTRTMAGRPPPVALLMALLGALLAVPGPGADTARAAEPLEQYAAKIDGLGTDFRLTDHRGEAFDTSSLRGKVVVLFFGYTHCPDICPTTLLDVGRALEGLGERRDEAVGLFVTVDPERDGVALLRDYVTHFPGGVVGLTGTPEAVKAAADAYGVLYFKEEGAEGDDYFMAHTGFVYVLDRTGAVRYLLPHNGGAPLVSQALRVVLGRD